MKRDVNGYGIRGASRVYRTQWLLSRYKLLRIYTRIPVFSFIKSRRNRGTKKYIIGRRMIWRKMRLNIMDSLYLLGFCVTSLTL